MLTRKALIVAALSWGLAGFTCLGLPLSAAAEQRADWLMSGPGSPGNYATIDVAFGGIQAGLEHREAIFGGANQLTLRGSAITAVPFGGAQLDADLRILVLTLGMSGGVSDNWRNQTFGASSPFDRKIRREREASGDFNSATFGWFEGRAQLDLPFNDFVLFHNVNSIRSSGAPSRSFDNQIGVVHDGNYVRSDFNLFFKHRDYGAIGPMAQVLNFPLGDRRFTQINYGFMLLTRAGLVRRDDFVVFQMLWNVGDSLGGIDNRDTYGMALLRGPVTFLLAYRSIISL